MKKNGFEFSEEEVIELDTETDEDSSDNSDNSDISTDSEEDDFLMRIKDRGEIILSIIAFNDDDQYMSELKQIVSGQLADYLDRIEIIEVEGDNEIEAYQSGFLRAQGTYVSFIYASSYYSDRTLRTFIERKIPEDEDEHLIFFVKPVYINPKGNKVAYFPNSPRKYIYKETSPHVFNLCMGSYFFHRDLITNEFFYKGYTAESFLYGMIDLIERKKECYYLTKGQYFFRKAIFDAYNYSEQFYKEYYTPTIRDEFIPLLKKYDHSLYVQYALYYLFTVRYLCNWNTRDKGLLDEKELQEFFEVSSDFLQELDDEVIIEETSFSPEILPKYMRFHMLAFKNEKNGGSPYGTARYSRKNMIMTYNDRIMIYKKDVKFYIYDINYENEELSIDGRLSSGFSFDFSRLSVFVKIKDEIIPAVRNNIYSFSKVFNVTVDKAYTFQIRIPQELFENGASIKAYYAYEGHEFAIPMTFGKVQSRLCEKYAGSYWEFGNWFMQYKKKGTGKIVIFAKSTKTRIKLENLLWKRYFTAFVKKKDIRAGKSIVLRALYWMTKRKYRNKHVWLMFDQLFKGGDNAEYLFRYAADKGDIKSILPYYIINKDAVEYPGLKKKYGKQILEFNSIRCKLMALHSEMIFATRCDVHHYVAIANLLEKYVRGLYNAHVVCLQHGLTIQRIAQYQNRLFDNYRLYFLVSPIEKINISHEVYGYDDNMLVMTGAPRYDGLISNDKKQILITPTWRRSVTAGTNTKGSRNEYSVNFKHTEYFKIYNDLINDADLIRAAKETGYKLIYLIHPILSPQIEDYSVNDSVEIIPGSEVNYEKILSESSLMITDYSGIQFDFAYMRKPVVYYHPASLPPQYDSNVYDYQTIAPGPVYAHHKELVDALCKYMKNGCQMEEEYRKRADRFFAFNDQNNSMRAYQAGVKYTIEHFGHVYN